MNTDMDTKKYFENIGAWPEGASERPGRLMLTYVTGFVLSLLFTGVAYYFAVHHEIPQTVALVVMVGLAVMQFVVQMTCFLHIDLEKANQPKLLVLGATGIIVFILVAGSLWIMSDLNTRMMPSDAQMEQYMQGQTGI